MTPRTHQTAHTIAILLAIILAFILAPATGLLAAENEVTVASEDDEGQLIERVFTLSPYIEGLLDAADESAFKASINLEAGVDYQPADADLTTLGSGDGAPLTTGINASAITTGNLDTDRLPLAHEHTSIADVILAEPDLVAYWPHDETTGSTLADAHGTNDTTSTGTISYSLRADKTGRSRTYTSGTASIPETNFDWERTQAFSLEATVQLDNNSRTGGGVSYPIVAKIQGSGAFRGYVLQMRWTGSVIVTQFAIINSLGSNYINVQSANMADYGVYHIIATYDGSSTAGGTKIWVNGRSVASTDANSLSATVLNDVPLTIGSDAVGGRFPGRISDVAIYDAALTEAQVRAHFRAVGGVDEIRRDMPVPVILDQDWATDCGDFGSVAVMHGLAQRGLITPIAMIQSSTNAHGLPAVDAINRWYGRVIPLGKHVGTAPTINGDSDTFIQEIKEIWGDPNASSSDYESGLTVYRKALAAARDGSVVICAGGQWGPLAQLLASPADSISPLTGAQLITLKVRELVAMAGNYGQTTTGQPNNPEYNIVVDLAQATTVLETWPTPVTIMTNEPINAVFSGPSTSIDPARNPIRYAYANASHATAGTREAWDESMLMWAAYGQQWAVPIMRNGVLDIDGFSYTTLDLSTAGNVSMIWPLHSVAVTGSMIDTLYDDQPGGSWVSPDTITVSTTVANTGTPDGVANITVQAIDPGTGADRATRYLARVWVSSTATGAATDLGSETVTTGNTVVEIASDAAWLIASDDNGEIVMAYDTASDGTIHVSVEVAGSISTDSEAITGNP